MNKKDFNKRLFKWQQDLRAQRLRRRRARKGQGKNSSAPLRSGARKIAIAAAGAVVVCMLGGVIVAAAREKPASAAAESPSPTLIALNLEGKSPGVQPQESVSPAPQQLQAETADQPAQGAKDAATQPTATPTAQPTAAPTAESPAPQTAEPTPAPTSTPTPTPQPTPQLFHRGDENEMIAKAQERLMELYYMDSDEPSQYFDYSTEFALQCFQRQHKLTVDGVLGGETLEMLFSEEAQNYTIDPETQGYDVQKMQERLKELGYFSGTTTTLYGEKTEAAVRAFQKRNGLKVDARIGVATRDAMYSPNAKRAPNTTSSENYSKPSGSSSALDKFISAAKGKKGSTYVRGAEGPSKFDCSGFVYYALRQAGIKTGRLNAAGFSQVSSWEKVSSVSKLKKGDLIFWRSPSSSRVSHTGIYLGGGEFIHASSSKGKVIISSFSNYWKDNFVCGRRVF